MCVDSSPKDDYIVSKAPDKNLSINFDKVKSLSAKFSK